MQQQSTLLQPVLLFWSSAQPAGICFVLGSSNPACEGAQLHQGCAVTPAVTRVFSLWWTPNPGFLNLKCVMAVAERFGRSTSSSVSDLEATGL